MALVAIVGRPNVGKSTLFNRLVGMRKAIVDDTAGTTRDRHYGRSDWNGREFSLIDTGGYITGSDDVFEQEIRKQVLLAIDEADVILFLVEVSTGITDLDLAVADLLRRTKKRMILVVNKVDNNDQQYLAHEFYSFGLGDPITISSMSGSGTGEMMDAIVAALPDDAPEEESDLPRITIVGRPNVGKSSLTNALLGEERNIVTPVAGTTRDAIHTRYNKFGMDFYLVDTAGLRKKGKVTEDLEFYSVMRSIRSIESSDVCILMLDAAQGIESQDMNIFSLIVRNKKGCVIVVNKWDLVEDKAANTMKEWREFILGKLAPFSDVPVIFTSVPSKQRIMEVLQTALRAHANRKRKVATSALNDYLLPIIEATPPPAIKGKYIRIKYIQQLPSPTPAFAFFANLPQYIREPYRRFLENKLRGEWDFEGVPIQIYFRQK